MESQNDSPKRSGWRTLFTLLLGVVFVIAFLGFLAGIVVRRHLLDPQLYAEALAENNVYERVYTEVLADPALQDQIAEITGIEIDLVVGELYAQFVSALYLVLPPTEMQAGTENFLENLTSYISGEQPILEPRLGFAKTLTPEVLAERIVTALQVGASEAIDKTIPILESKTGEFFEEDATQYLDQISQGRLGSLPDRLLTASVGGMTEDRREQLVDSLLGPAATATDEATRLQIEAALAADDLPSAISLATAERLTGRVTEAVSKLESKLATSPALNGVAAAAVFLGETEEAVINGLNTVRHYADLVKRAMIPLAVVMLVAMALIIWLNSDDLRSALRAFGWTLIIASGLPMLLWLIGGLWLRSNVQARLAAQSGLPPSLDNVVDDVIGSLLSNVWTSVWTTALFWLVIGLIALAFSYSSQLFGFLRRLLQPIWEYKWWVLGGLFGVFVLVPLVWGLITADQRAARLPCNGYPELCDRPIDEVVFATTHNSMSIAEYGWIWPMHDGTITEQLDAGVRGLLIDTHYPDEEAEVEEYLAGLSPEERTVAEKVIELAIETDERLPLLCHGLCKMGHTPLAQTLDEIRVWLEEHPREVVVIVIQDEISPTDTEEAMVRTGLDGYIYSHPVGQPWPTLRQMIDANRRLVVLSENASPPPDWYVNVWESTEETPYTFVVKEQFSCEPNRGGTGKPFFLLNHWIQRGSPNRVDAAIVNDYDFLLARAQQCAEERGQIPNFVAVNFYGQGDLMGVVNTLNGVGAAE